jgi:hypothetical protein
VPPVPLELDEDEVVVSDDVDVDEDDDDEPLDDEPPPVDELELDEPCACVDSVDPPPVPGVLVSPLPHAPIDDATRKTNPAPQTRRGPKVPSPRPLRAARRAPSSPKKKFIVVRSCRIRRREAHKQAGRSIGS